MVNGIDKADIDITKNDQNKEHQTLPLDHELFVLFSP